MPTSRHRATRHAHAGRVLRLAHRRGRRERHRGLGERRERRRQGVPRGGRLPGPHRREQVPDRLRRAAPDGDVRRQEALRRRHRADPLPAEPHLPGQDRADGRRLPQHPGERPGGLQALLLRRARRRRRRPQRADTRSASGSTRPASTRTTRWTPSPTPSSTRPAERRSPRRCRRSRTAGPASGVRPCWPRTRRKQEELESLPRRRAQLPQRLAVPQPDRRLPGPRTAPPRDPGDAAWRATSTPTATTTTTASSRACSSPASSSCRPPSTRTTR